MYKAYGVVRHKKVREDASREFKSEVEVCVGSSPISGKPYWEKLDQAAIQVLFMRDEAYACDVRDLCKQKDGDSAEGYYYHLLSLQIDI